METAGPGLAAVRIDSGDLGDEVAKARRLLDHPTSGFVYKLVEVDGRPVQKRSPGKETVGGRKSAWRIAGHTEVVGPVGSAWPESGRPLQHLVVESGRIVERPDLQQARSLHREARDALGPQRSLGLERTPD